MDGRPFKREVCDKSVIAAKNAELENWASNGVYEEVDDEGQDSMSVRWVITSKVVDDKDMFMSKNLQKT